MKENKNIIGYVGSFNGLKVYETRYFDTELKNQGCIQIIGGSLYMTSPLSPVAGFHEETGEISIYSQKDFNKELAELVKLKERTEFKEQCKKAVEYKEAEVEVEQVKDADVIDDLLSKVGITCDNLLKNIKIMGIDLADGPDYTAMG